MAGLFSLSEDAIRLVDISVGFTHRDSKDSLLLERASLRIGRGEAVCLEGPSGCGKSTLLFLMAGLLRPVSGTIEVFGKNLLSLRGRHRKRFRREHLHLMPQSLQMFPHLSVIESLAAVQYLQNVPDFSVAREALKAVGLLDKSDLKPMQLSGGERQRACFARALVSQAPLYLLDEPTSNLDRESALQVLRLLKEEQQIGRTIVMATQDPTFADLNGRRIRIENRRIASIPDE